MAADLQLRPLRAHEYDAWYRAVTDEYADDMARHGDTQPEAARTKAEADMARVLSEGLATAGHTVLVLEGDGAALGRLWVAERTIDERRVLFVYDVHVAEEWRGRGYGRAAMSFVEELARERGIGRIELNVFGGNRVARSLYRSMGYVERAVLMAKDLGAEAAAR